MSTRLYTSGALLAGSILLIGCSTVQENPNWQYSSKYGQPETVQTAQAGPVTTNDTSLVAASNAADIASPTEEAYNADAMPGTPGYAILMAEQAAEAETAPTPQALVPVPEPVYSGPREVDYDYAQNVIVADVPDAAPEPRTAIEPSSTPIVVPTGQTYVVKPGDTIYSLSRRICAPIADIVTANGIGADYAISIGQTLTLPTSRC